jgi:hypothetical protein
VRHLGDLGNARDRGAIDTSLCTRCRHSYHRLGDIDCHHQPWAAASPAAIIVRAWLWGQRGRDCPEFKELS